jgi:transcriptional regulator with XRE-family HTH domain
MAMMANSVSESGTQESIGQRLRRLRTERSLSQRELAEPGVSYAYISRIEAGTRQPSVKALRKLARRLGVSAEYLETGSEISPEEQREMRLADAELELRLEQDPDAAVMKLRALLDESTAAGDVVATTRARIVLATAALDAGRPDEAVELLELVADQGEVLPTARPDVFAHLGKAYALLGQASKSIDLFERCLAEVEENEPENIAARVRYATSLSYALAETGAIERAQDVLTEIVEQSEELADTGMQVKLYWSLARLAFMRGQHSTALEYARRALALVEATEDTVQLGRAYLMCGVILVRQDRSEEALPQFEQAERLLGPRPSPTDFAYLRTEQAKAAVLLGRGREAAKRAREALDLLGETDPAERGAAWLALADGLSLEGEAPAAMEAFRRSTEALEAAGKLAEAAEAHRAWSRALRAAGRETEALDVLERAAELAVQAGRTEIRATR